MPIYEQTYRRYEARGPLRTVRFWPITREALRLVLARRAFLGLLLMSWGWFFVQVVHVYVVTRFPEAGRVLPIDGALLKQIVRQKLLLESEDLKLRPNQTAAFLSREKVLRFSRGPGKEGWPRRRRRRSSE